MATYTIVDKNTDPLGPNEIHAGGTINVTNGDLFIIAATANDNIRFESATGNPANFEIRFETSNANDFTVEIKENLDVGIAIPSGADLSDIDIQADKSLSVIMTAGDDVSLGSFVGSDLGVDVVTIGHRFSTDHDIKLNGGDNFLTIGDDATIQKIDTDEGEDTITIGDGLIAHDINTGEGNDALTIGNSATVGNIDTGKGNDTITIGDDLQQSPGTELDPKSIKTGDGDDSIIIGENAFVENIDAGKGNDTISIGNDLTAKDIKADDGNNALSIGDNAFLEDIETGNGDDTITIGDNLFADDISTDEGSDALTIGDGATVHDINTAKGDDTVSVGDSFTANKLETKDGDDVVIVGSGGSIDDIDGGADSDKLISKTGFPNSVNFERVVCFVRRTMIETDTGDVPIENLKAGDRVRTLDHGLQRIRWIGSTRVAGLGVNAPVRIAAGALGNIRTLWVSQQHRILMSGWNVELSFGLGEVLVAAKHLVSLPGIQIVDVPSVEYFHLLFDRHELVFAEGIESESFHPGCVGMSILSDDARAEIYRLFPSLLSDPDSYGQSARFSLRSFEARVLAA